MTILRRMGASPCLRTVKLEMFLLYSCVLLVCVSSALSATTVKTEYGTIWSDLILTTEAGNKYLAFRGIPYAAPPVGPLRFRPPQRHAKWREVRNATELGTACYQIVGKSGIEKRGVFLPFNISEDCLFVNVYTPDVKPKKLLPVLVYIHGGTFRTGSGNGYGAQNFMDSSPIVFVTFNYRLGVFGFLSSGNGLVSGNFGLKDQVALLRWVQANIKNFGGNPKRVTLMGQSSGAHNVHAHMLSPASKGLFRRAVILSGSALGMWGYYPPQSHEAEHTFNLLLEQTHCKKSNITLGPNETKASNSEASLECLRGLSAHDLKQAEQYFLANGSISFVFRAVIEPKTVSGAFLTSDPRELNYWNTKMPLWIGSVSAEGLIFAFLFLKNHANETEYSEALNEDLPFSLHHGYWLKSNLVPSFTEELMNFYFQNPRNITAGDLPALNKLFGKVRFQIPFWDTIVSYPGKVFAYNYDHMNEASTYYKIAKNYNMEPLGNFTGALHNDDLISIFGPDDPEMLPLPLADRKISDKLVIYLKNFIQTGNPNVKVPVQPRWNEVQSKNIEYLHITDTFQMKSGLPDNTEYAFYQAMPIPWRKTPDIISGRRSQRRTKAA